MSTIHCRYLEESLLSLRHQSQSLLPLPRPCRPARGVLDVARPGDHDPEEAEAQDAPEVDQQAGQHRGQNSRPGLPNSPVHLVIGLLTGEIWRPEVLSA